MMLKADGTGYESWPSAYSQPSLKAEDYLLAFPKLHLVSPAEGGTLTVTDKDGKELPDGSEITPGTLLTLTCTESSLPEIWTEGSVLCIRQPDGLPGAATAATSTADVRILTFDGRLLHAFRSVPGLNRWQLPTGLYIVQVSKTVRKVQIK